MKRAVLALAMMLPGAAMAQEQVISLICDLTWEMDANTGGARQIQGNFTAQLRINPAMGVASMQTGIIPCLNLLGTINDITMEVECSVGLGANTGRYEVKLDRIAGSMENRYWFNGEARPVQFSVCRQVQPVF